MIDWLITVAIALAGLAFALARSPYAVNLTVFVFVFNRGLRRIIDYYVHDEFQPLSPISLTPLLVSGALLLAAIVHSARIPPWGRAVLGFLGASVAYAFGIGYLRVNFAAVYALAEVLAPLGLFAYVLLLKPDDAMKDRWIRAFAWAAILTSVYGWYQYMTIPPWDKFWLIATKMYGYMGIPLPTKMSAFSTMSERGVLAGFLGFSLVPMIVSPRWRPLPGILGWLGVILVFSVILLTLSRAGLLYVAIGTVCYLFINGGRGGKQIAIGVLVLGIAAWKGMDLIPNADRVKDRFETLGEMNEDGSFVGRVQIISSGFPSLMESPQGLGLGAVGLASRVNTGGNLSGKKISVVDAGWFNIILTYGIPGSVLLLTAMLRAWKLLAYRYRHPRLRDDHVLLARAMMITLIPCCFVGDLLTGFSIFWLALGCGISLPAVRGPRPQPGGLRRMHPAGIPARVLAKPLPRPR